MLAIDRFDMPASFIERFRPVLTDTREKGLPRYLFDRYGLEFFRRMTTGEPVVPQAVWSVVHSVNALELVAGEHPNAIRYVVTELPHDPNTQRIWPLPRRLTLRQKIRRQTLRQLIDDLSEANVAVPDEVTHFIEERLHGEPVRD